MENGTQNTLVNCSTVDVQLASVFCAVKTSTIISSRDGSPIPTRAAIACHGHQASRNPSAPRVGPPRPTPARRKTRLGADEGNREPIVDEGDVDRGGLNVAAAPAMGG